jgi:hypothetical protein
MIAKRIKAAFAGRKFWMKLKKEYDIDNGVYVLLMPEDDPELNEQALLHIDDLVNHRKARGVIILTDQKQVMDTAKVHSGNILALNKVTESEIDNLLSFFELYAFTERLLIVSLTRPFGSKLYNTLGISGVTKEDLVCLSIFLIRDWTSAECVNG